MYTITALEQQALSLLHAAGGTAPTAALCQQLGTAAAERALDGCHAKGLVQFADGTPPCVQLTASGIQYV